MRATSARPRGCDHGRRDDGARWLSTPEPGIQISDGGIGDVIGSRCDGPWGHSPLKAMELCDQNPAGDPDVIHL